VCVRGGQARRLENPGTESATVVISEAR
jgi:hypothetical protein